MASNAREHRLYASGELDPKFEPVSLGAALREKYKSAAEWFQKVSPGDSHYREGKFFSAYAAICRRLQRSTALFTRARTVHYEVYNHLWCGPIAAIFRRGRQLRKLWKETAGLLNQFNFGYASGERNFKAPLRILCAPGHDPDDTQTALLRNLREQTGPRPGEPRMEGLEVLRQHEESYWQLKPASPIV